MKTILKSDIFALMSRIYRNAGLDDREAIEGIYHHLLQNEMSGKHSHGFIRMAMNISAMRQYGVPSGRPSLAVDSGALAIVDGQNHIGLVAGRYAVDVAIQKAADHGIAFVGTRHYIGTTGTMNYYNRLFVDAGLVGVAGCNSIAHVCHPDGVDPVIGTNPISFGLPSKETPCVIDVTTAQWAYGKLLDLHQAGRPMPHDAIIDKNGDPSTCFEDIMKGYAMLPMNGFKGFGLGLAVEILSGALIGAKCGAQVVEGFDGMFFIALDPDRLVGRTVFEDHVETLLQSIKTSRQAVVDKEILIPGERSYRMYKDNCSKDTVDLSDAVYNEMKALDS